MLGQGPCSSLMIRNVSRSGSDTLGWGFPNSLRQHLIPLRRAMSCVLCLYSVKGNSTCSSHKTTSSMTEIISWISARRDHIIRLPSLLALPIVMLRQNAPEDQSTAKRQATSPQLSCAASTRAPRLEPFGLPVQRARRCAEEERQHT